MRILITAGPTREYIDDVRFLSNASSGRMGYALAVAAIERGHEVVLVTGPADLSPPAGCELHRIETTDQLRQTCLQLFPACDGVIATAAVCDYRPRHRTSGKMTKTGQPVILELVETSDVLAELGSQKQHQWNVVQWREGEYAGSRGGRQDSNWHGDDSPVWFSGSFGGGFSATSV